MHGDLVRTLVEGGDVHHDLALPVRERGRVGRHAGHRPTQRPELRHAHHRGRGPEVLEDRLRLGAVDRVDEHRSRRRHGVVLLVLGRVDLRVRHRPDQVRDRLGERSERREGALAGLRVAGVRHERHDDQLAVGLLGDERHRRGGHHVRDRRELLGRGLRLGHEPGDRVDVGGEDQHAADDGVDLVQAEPEPRRDAEVPAAAADRPEQVRLVLGVDATELAVRGHDVGGQQVVDRQAVLADEVAHAASERDPADPDRARVAEPDPEAVFRSGGREPDGGQPGLGPCRSCFDIDLERPHVGEVDHDPPSETLWPGMLWPPLRTASSSPLSRASETTRTTSCRP